jgi:hypothetical protein
MRQPISSEIVENLRLRITIFLFHSKPISLVFNVCFSVEYLRLKVCKFLDLFVDNGLPRLI